MTRILSLAAVLGFMFVAPISADDTKKAEPIVGKLTCGKCALSETDACSNVLVAKGKDGKEVKYYLKDTGKAAAYHVCKGEKEVSVTGKVVEKDGKKWIEDAKVEAKK